MSMILCLRDALMPDKKAYLKVSTSGLFSHPIPNACGECWLKPPNGGCSVVPLFLSFGMWWGEKRNLSCRFYKSEMPQQTIIQQGWN